MRTRPRSLPRRFLLACAATGLVLTPALVPTCVSAQDTLAPQRAGIVVRYSEGTTHGFLHLQDRARASLASGDLVQIPGSAGIESRMVLHFRDGSSFEETVTFTQHHRFALEAYHLVQQGPAFPRDIDAHLERDGHYLVVSTTHDDHRVSRFEGHMDLPSDVSNGLVVTLAKNLRSGDTAIVHLVAFTPKPQLVELLLASDGVDSVTIGSSSHPVTRFLVKSRLGGLKGVLARVLGKMPDDSHVWILTERAPAFIRFEGPLYDGPVWSLSQIAAEWRDAHSQRSN
jgi:hypothetical protein